MNKLFLTIALTICVGIILAQDQKPRFDVSNLTKAEIQDCEKFKNKKGQTRWDEFEKIKHIFPSCKATLDSSGKILTFDEETVSLIMKKRDLFKLIGEPDIEGGIYEIGQKKHDCVITFVFNDKDEVINFFYSNCSMFFDKTKGEAFMIE